jgi:hypothetical protein
MGPLRRFCSIGWKQRPDPSNWFSIERYRAVHPDVAKSHVNPLIHYVLVRRDALRQLAWKPSGVAEPLEYTIDEAMVDLLRVVTIVCTPSHHQRS